MNNEWEYYNHALVPTLPPHMDPDTSWMKDSAKSGKSMLAESIRC